MCFVTSGAGIGHLQLQIAKRDLEDRLGSQFGSEYAGSRRGYNETSCGGERHRYESSKVDAEGGCRERVRLL